MDRPKYSIVPEAGQRELIIGKTGSGKTSGAIYVLQHLDAAPAIIYDVKIEPKFEALKNSIVVETPVQITEAVEAGESDYIIVRPPLDLMTDPGELDRQYLENHYYFHQGLPAYIDEALAFHRNSQAGPGLLALMTRGRSKGITTLISSQRPKKISRECITEIDKAMIYRLQDRDDRKRIDDLISDFSVLKSPPRFHFYFWDANADDDANGENPPVLFNPVPLDAAIKSGYVDISADTQASAVPTGSDEKQRRERLWL